MSICIIKKRLPVFYWNHFIISLFFTICFGETNSINAQNPIKNGISIDDWSKQNSISAEINYLYLGLNYERVIIPSSKGIFSGNIGFGTFGPQAGAYVLEIMPDYIFGRKSNHLDLGLGIRMLTDFDQTIILPNVFIGYRYQRPGGRFKFRAGYSPLLINFLNVEGTDFDNEINQIFYLYGGPRLSFGYNF